MRKRLPADWRQRFSSQTSRRLLLHPKWGQAREGISACLHPGGSGPCSGAFPLSLGNPLHHLCPRQWSSSVLGNAQLPLHTLRFSPSTFPPSMPWFPAGPAPPWTECGGPQSTGVPCGKTGLPPTLATPVLLLQHLLSSLETQILCGHKTPGGEGLSLTLADSGPGCLDNSTSHVSLEKMVEKFVYRALDNPVPLYSRPSWAEMRREALLDTDLGLVQPGSHRILRRTSPAVLTSLPFLWLLVCPLGASSWRMSKNSHL